jgi:hypothetical protein
MNEQEELDGEQRKALRLRRTSPRFCLRSARTICCWNSRCILHVSATQGCRFGGGAVECFLRACRRELRIKLCGGRRECRLRSGGAPLWGR